MESHPAKKTQQGDKQKDKLETCAKSSVFEFPSKETSRETNVKTFGQVHPEQVSRGTQARRQCQNHPAQARNPLKRVRTPYRQTSLEKNNRLAMASHLEEMASNLLAMASTILARIYSYLDTLYFLWSLSLLSFNQLLLEFETTSSIGVCSGLIPELIAALLTLTNQVALLLVSMALYLVGVLNLRTKAHIAAAGDVGEESCTAIQQNKKS